MARRNFLIEGVSCTGKTSVYRELRRRGYAAVDGDNELAYQGDPETGSPMEGASHKHHIWDVTKVDALLRNEEDVLFFCGGSRNYAKFIARFDDVFVLDIDRATLEERLDQREKGDWGATPKQRAIVLHLHDTKEDTPQTGTIIDATAPLTAVVDTILRLSIGGDEP